VPHGEGRAVDAVDAINAIVTRGAAFVPESG
jgi:hypothetical protein